MLKIGLYRLDRKDNIVFCTMTTEYERKFFQK